MEECENCNKSHDADFELEHWYYDTWCIKCNEELPRECAQCDAHVDEDERYCSDYCAKMAHYDCCDSREDY